LQQEVATRMRGVEVEGLPPGRGSSRSLLLTCTDPGTSATLPPHSSKTSLTASASYTMQLTRCGRKDPPPPPGWGDEHIALGNGLHNALKHGSPLQSRLTRLVNAHLRLSATLQMHAIHHPLLLCSESSLNAARTVESWVREDTSRSSGSEKVRPASSASFLQACTAASCTLERRWGPPGRHS